MFISQGEADKANLVFNDEYPVSPWAKNIFERSQMFRVAVQKGVKKQ